MNDLEKRINIIEARNRKVEFDKEWETSSYRKISIAISTYFIIVIVMFLLKFDNVFIGALIPTFGFLISTPSLDILKKIYLKNKNK